MNLIKINGSYGARIGNIQVFTREGAINAYRNFCKVCLKNLTMESVSVLQHAEQDMCNLGFEREHLENIEIEVCKEMGEENAC